MTDWVTAVGLLVISAICAACTGRERADDTDDGTHLQIDLLDTTGLAEISPEGQFSTTRSTAYGMIFPFDEAPRDPSFLSLRNRLMLAARNKDHRFLLSLIDDRTKLSFGAEQGKKAFSSNWGLDSDPQNSPVWQVLWKILNTGGGFADAQRAMFIAPYYFEGWPDAFDAVTHAHIAGEGVRLRESPSLGGRVVAMLSYDIVAFDGERTAEETHIDGEMHPWYAVELLDGRKGWIYGKYFATPMDYRIGFAREDGNWYIAFLVAGD